MTPPQPQMETAPNEILVLHVRRLDSPVVRRVALDGFPMVIGRGHQADIVLDDEKVSRKHATIERVSGVVCIRDLDSSNGLFVNGVAQGSAELESGTKVRIGDHALECSRINLGRLANLDETER